MLRTVLVCAVLAVPANGQGERGGPPEVLAERLPAEALLLRVDGDSPGDWFGYSVAAAGDLNGDGVPDFVVGAHQNENWGRRPAPTAAAGYVRAYSGATGEGLYTLHSSGSKNIDGSDDHFGYSVSSVGDLDGDGVREIFVGAYLFDAEDDDPDSNDENTGGAFLFSGATGAWLHTLPGVAWGDRFGYVVSPIADMDGDGREDLLIGVEKAEVDIENQGSIQILSSATFAQLARSNGPGFNSHLGCMVAPLGDVDGDGVPDFAGGAFLYATEGKSREGKAEVFSGATGAKLFSWQGPRALDKFGYAVGNAGDVDGDGRDDVAVGARQSGWVGDFSGPGFVHVYTSRDGSLLYEHYGDAEGDQFGCFVGGAGDRNGDGRPDLFVGAPAAISVNREEMPDRPGRLHLLSGVDGRRLRTIEGLEANDQFGCSVAELGDVNGDGLSDVLVGAPENVIGQTRAGYAVVVSGAVFAQTYVEELQRGAQAVLAELARDAAGVDPERLAWLHHATLWLWTEHDWTPPGFATPVELVARLDELLGAPGVAPELARTAARREWHAAVRLRDNGTPQLARELVGERSMDTDNVPLFLEVARAERDCGLWTAAQARLAQIGRFLADPARASAVGARVRWLLQRGRFALELGNHERAREDFATAYQQALSVADRQERQRLLANALTERLHAAGAVGAWDELGQAWRNAQAILVAPSVDDADGPRLSPGAYARVRLAYAAGLAARERSQATTEGAAIAHFTRVVATEGLALAEELQAHIGLASAHLDLGHLQPARNALAAARRRMDARATDRSFVPQALAIAALEARLTRGLRAR